MVSGLNELAGKYPDKIYNIRGMGISQGFTLRNPEQLQDMIKYALLQEKMILLEAGVDTIRFRSALDVTIPEKKLMLEKLENCLKNILRVRGEFSCGL
jgi:L-lysine 6-transaminase